MNSRMFAHPFVTALMGALLIATPAAAQLRFSDRIQTQPQASSRWETAIQNAQQGRAKIGRHMNKGGSPQAEPSHDTSLAMPHWTSSISVQGTEYPFSVIGTDPSQGTSTTISTVIVPYRLIMPDGGIFDATTDLVDGVTPVAGIVNSPVFQPVPWSIGPTKIGTTQFGDAMLRSNFWSMIPGDKSGYHVLLGAPKVLPVQVISVPVGSGYTTVDTRGVRLGVVDFAWLAETIASMTANLGIPPQALSIHVMSAIEGIDLNGGGSLGFHDTVFVGTANNPIYQPFIQTGYFSVNSAAVQGNINASGTSVLGHEVAEWLNDPEGDNVVAAWQDPGFPHVCDNPYLEVADPLEYISPGLTVTLNGRNYHFPEVAFLAWFARDRSTSVNGWYSSLDTFSNSSAACPVYTSLGYVGFDFTGATTSVLTGVNNSVNNAMKMVGYASAAPSPPTGIALDASFDPATGAVSITNLLQVYFPGSQYTVPAKINDHGQIVGFYVDNAGAQHGFVLNNGRYSSIDFPGAASTEALAINNWPLPVIAGDYVDGGGKVHGFVFLDGQFVPVNANFATNLSVTGINDFGQMTGIYDLDGQLGTAQTYGFTGILGFLTPLNYPSDPLNAAPTSTLLNSLNNTGQIVGTFETQFPAFLRVDAFLEGGGNFEPLETGLDAFLADQALGINDAGIMVGSFQDLVGVHAAIAIPSQLYSIPAMNAPMLVALPFPLR